MFEISVEGHFDAAHSLRGYGGKCEGLHGHRFRIIVTLETGALNEIGLAYDFVELKRHLEKVLEGFDHKHLNEVSPFDKINPSSENIAVTIFDRLNSLLGGAGSLTCVDVWESPENHVCYRP
jgi:6-pyruvoyltetrahydropterin/6-carboxytetrahydropterin synthase